MRYFAYLLIVILVAYAGEWTYRTFSRPIDQPTEQLLALAEHFNSIGLKGHIYPVRHGFRHSSVTATAAFEIDGYPLPISIDQAPTYPAAEDHLRSVKASPNFTNPQRNGLLVMYLPMCGDDTTVMATKVSHAFASFKGGA